MQSILGMNVIQITGEAGNSSLWIYFAIAVPLMMVTLGGSFFWSLRLKRTEEETAKAKLKALSPRT